MARAMQHKNSLYFASVTQCNCYLFSNVFSSDLSCVTQWKKTREKYKRKLSSFINAFECYQTHEPNKALELADSVLRVLGQF